jgi:hypothetical protein
MWPIPPRRRRNSDDPVRITWSPSFSNRSVTPRCLWRRFRLCKLHSSQRRDKVQGIEKTCRLNGSVSNRFVCNARFSARSISWCHNLIRSRVEFFATGQTHACLQSVLLACTRDYTRVKGVAKNILENLLMAIYGLWCDWIEALITTQSGRSPWKVGSLESSTNRSHGAVAG